MAGFEQIIGQQHIVEHFQNAVSMGKVSHAYILNGEDAESRHLIAEAFSRALQCQDEKVKPCGECRSCKQTVAGNQPDIIWVRHEKPTSIGVEEVRTQLVGDILIKPYSSPYKIYIIDEAEKLTVQAQNVLLKTVEEPPAYAVIIFLTANAESLLPTILSRCILLNMRPVSEDVIRSYLKDKAGVLEDKAELCTAFSQGILGKALKLAQSESFDAIRNHAVVLLKNIENMELSELLGSLKELTEFKTEIEDYLGLLLVWYRDVLLFKATNDANMLVFREEYSAVSRQAAKSSYEGLEEIITAIQKAEKRLKANVNFELAMELMLLTIKEN